MQGVIRDAPKICYLLLGHSKLDHTTVYLHLSRRHLQAVPSPLEAIEVSSAGDVKRSRPKKKR